MSFKISDFVIYKVTKEIFYIKEQFKSDIFRFISLKNGTESTNMISTRDFTIHPTLGIEATDLMDLKNQSTLKGVITGLVPGEIVLAGQNSLYGFLKDEALTKLTNKSNPHWNTCAQHYRTHVLNQQCPVVQTANKTHKPTTSNTFIVGDYVTNNYQFWEVANVDHHFFLYSLWDRKTNSYLTMDFVQAHSTLTKVTNNIHSTYKPNFQVGDIIKEKNPVGSYLDEGEVFWVDYAKMTYTIDWGKPKGTAVTRMDEDIPSIDTRCVKSTQTLPGNNTHTCVWSTGVGGTASNISSTPQLDKAIETINKEFSSCAHDWKDYHGFNESFSFCTKCDSKKDIQN